jgi:hypothetical protein
VNSDRRTPTGATLRQARILLAALPAAAWAAGCAPHAPERFGTSLPTATRLSASEIETRGHSLDGKPVATTGRITRVCQHVGCWFYVTDGRSELYVDLEGGRRFVIPMNSAGRRAEVVGTVRTDHSEARLIARGVTLW